MRSRSPSSSTGDEISLVDGGEDNDNQSGELSETLEEPKNPSITKSILQLEGKESQPWPPSPERKNVSSEKLASTSTATLPSEPLNTDKMDEPRLSRRPKPRSLWLCSLSTFCVTLLSAVAMAAIIHSFRTRQCDANGCKTPFMRPAYAPLVNFDTEHTRFASKYKTCLYRELEYDNSSLDPKGVPVLFIPGNAGSYKQVRSLAKEAARQWAEMIRADERITKEGMRKLDFFTVDFNEDITAFHGQTLLDQAEYLNDAVAYILSLYHDARRSTMDTDLPDPSSVIIIGHSMGGVVARTMLTMPNYQPNSVNTIITLSAPHARAPVSFDEQIISTYSHINDYWRKAHSAKWASHNPLWHVTLISIAGGGLDTVVPSDYASVSSLLPDTHGFTVFTSSIPNVWLGIDHLAILWCEQLMKVVVRALLEVIDVKRAGQTKPRADRMRIFKKWFLTGMETNAEKTLFTKEPTILLTLEDNSDSIMALGERLVLRKLGKSGKIRAYLMPIPPLPAAGGTKFNLLTDQILEEGRDEKLHALFCSVFPLQPGHAQTVFSLSVDLSGDSTGSTRLACKNAASDAIRLPASNEKVKNPFDAEQPLSYLQYDLEDISDHQFVAIIDKSTAPTEGWAIAEFVDKASQKMQANVSLHGLLRDGLQVTLPADGPMVQEIYIPAMHSSLLAYKLSAKQNCSEAPLFAPLLRQYLSDPYESKYFVNAKEADINLHGSAPFMPPPLKPNSPWGISLQFWLDQTCNSPVEVSLRLDLWGSLGKLVMRYRTTFAAFPLLMVALVIRKQFKEYDAGGRFISFGEGLELVITQSFPVVLFVLSLLAVYFAATNSVDKGTTLQPSLSRAGESTHTTRTDFVNNDLLLGLQDVFFWFLAPLFALISMGTCVVVNYITVVILHLTVAIYSVFQTAVFASGDRRKISSAFSSSTPRRRIMTTLILLFFVASIVPYQFAYLVACIVQVATCTRALKFAYDNSHGDRHSPQWNFYHYAHSILILMLWITPINIPVLVVWIHNLAVHWLTSFSSHHNIISITPFMLLVETLTSGKMIPRVTSRLRIITSLLLLGLAGYAAIWGVTYAYRLHHIVNLVFAWFVAIHFSKFKLSVAGLLDLFNDEEDERSKQRPE